MLPSRSRNYRMPRLTNSYLEAAVEVLAMSGRPLMSTEITSRVLELGLLQASGRTPHRSMAARLYVAAKHGDPRFKKIAEPGVGPRARRNSVRWALTGEGSASSSSR